LKKKKNFNILIRDANKKKNEMKKNAQEMERMKQENLELRKKLAEKERDKTVEQGDTSVSVRYPSSKHNVGNQYGNPRPLVRRHPFTEEIMKTPLPTNWRNPTLEMYDGPTNPDENLDMFTTQVSLFTLDDTVLSKVFPISLKDPTLSWFTKLPLFSIDNFYTLSSMFGTQFATSRPHQLTSLALVNIRQEKGEPLRAFMERFRRMTLRIRNLSPEVALHHLMTALKPRLLSNTLCKKPVSNPEELRKRVVKFMELEELQEFRRQLREETVPKRSG